MPIVSSTDGSPTYTCWKRRSRAASFSTCLRYSSSVVAPIMRSSPRASIGLIMLPASIAPSAPPAPTIVCSSSTNVITSPAASVISFSTALRRSSNSPRYFDTGDHRADVERDQALALQPLRHVAVGDPAGEALDDRRLADARFADQHRIVLGAPRQHLDDAADLVVAADDRVDLAVGGAAGEVLPVLLEGGELLLRVLVGDAVAAADVAQHAEQLLAADAEPVVHRQQQVLDRDVVVLEVLAVLLGAVGDGVQLAGQARLVAADRAREPLDGGRSPCRAPCRATGRAWRARGRRSCRPGRRAPPAGGRA